MKELGKWQIISFVSRAMAMGLGVIQSFIIVRILTLGEWGTVQLAVSIGGALGIYQHLGLASASTREISAAKDDDDVFKIFLTSVFIRYCVTLPLVFGLFFFAKYIAENLYHNAALILPLKIYAITLLFQGFQSIFNSVISGTKRFRQLFLYQVLISVVSLFINLPLVYFFRVNGYFYAFIIFNIISSLSLWYLAFRPLNFKYKLPEKSEFKILFKEIFSISMAIYLVKIIYTNWEKIGSNLIGLSVTPEVVAIYAFALLYSKKLMGISDSVTDVNLPVLSEKYVKNMGDFEETFTQNFNKIFVIVVFIGTFAAYWAPLVSDILVGSGKYDKSFSLIPPMILAFIMYSFVNIVKSSVLIPAKMVKEMIWTFIALIGGTIAAFYFGSKGLNINVLTSMAWGMAIGGTFSTVYMIYSIYKKTGLKFVNIDHLAILIQGFAISLLCNVQVLWIKFLLFVPFMAMMLYAFIVSKFIVKEDLRYVITKAKRFLPRGNI